MICIPYYVDVSSLCTGALIVLQIELGETTQPKVKKLYALDEKRMKFFLFKCLVVVTVLTYSGGSN